MISNVWQADNGDGTYKILYDDGDSSRRKPAAKIRLVESSKAHATTFESHETSVKVEKQLLKHSSSSPSPSTSTVEDATCKSGARLTDGEASTTSTCNQNDNRSQAVSTPEKQKSNLPVLDPMSRACVQILHCIHIELCRNGFASAPKHGAHQRERLPKQQRQQSPASLRFGVFPTARYVFNTAQPGHRSVEVLIRAMMTGTSTCPILNVYVGTESHGTANSTLLPQAAEVRQRRVFKVCFAVPINGSVIASDVEKRAHVQIVQRLSPRFHNAFKPTLALDKLGTHPLQHIVG